MGDPRRMQKKWSRPSHPWQTFRIQEEKGLRREFGLKNMREIWKVKGLLTKYGGQAKRLTKEKSRQADVERKHLMTKLQSYGLLSATSQLSDILTLQPSDFLERRLQTVLVRKGLARSMKQARQFITHGHVLINGKIMNVPSYLVPVSEEASVEFRVASPFVDTMHPAAASE